ncbi:hypothetical protein BD410DRAFT_795962 [Rickenella mellea]|uniref:Uncharacterized protein n=1 Tax=Rickenella mellea TaxID=50990 RepID=A0A4Y7PKV6_9AGAM|nr:hypothetical protein BD410DRAFT_795962 [Rickenella mellea]
MDIPSMTSQAPTATYTECWVFSTATDGFVQSTPAAPIASGAECYVIFPTGGGIEKSPIPESEALPMNTEPAYSSPAHQSAGSHLSEIGGVVGGVIAFLFLVSMATYLVITRRERRRLASLKKHQWALHPGKWIVHEQKPEEMQMEMPAGAGGVKVKVERRGNGSMV